MLYHHRLRLEEPILQILYVAKTVFFRNNLAESEPIWMRFGTVWAKCGGWPWQILGTIPAVVTV